MEAPLVTFLSPCYNHSKYIIESLESVRKQTYKNIQHIIIDDCSTDDSVYKIEKWIEENEYKCEFIKHKSNKGISYSHNESLELAKGLFWTSLATDDIALPQRTEKFVEALKSSTAGMVVSDAKIIDYKGDLLFVNGYNSFTDLHLAGRSDVIIDQNYGSFDTLLFGNYICGSIMIKRSVFNKVGFFDEDLNIEDWEMWMKISREFKIVFLPEQLMLYRGHENNSGSDIDNSNIHYIKSFLKQKPFCTTEKAKSFFNSRIISMYVFNSDEDILNILKPYVNWFLYLKILRIKVLNRLKGSSAIVN